MCLFVLYYILLLALQDKSIHFPAFLFIIHCWVNVHWHLSAKLRCKLECKLLWINVSHMCKFKLIQLCIVHRKLITMTYKVLFAIHSSITKYSPGMIFGHFFKYVIVITVKGFLSSWKNFFCILFLFFFFFSSRPN